MKSIQIGGIILIRNEFNCVLVAQEQSGICICRYGIYVNDIPQKFKTLFDSEANESPIPLEGMVHLLKNFQKGADLRIFTNLKFLVDAINEKWYAGWMLNHWRYKSGKVVEHQDQWMLLVGLLGIAKDIKMIEIATADYSEAHGSYFNETCVLYHLEKLKEEIYENLMR